MTPQDLKLGNQLAELQELYAAKKAIQGANGIMFGNTGKSSKLPVALGNYAYQTIQHEEAVAWHWDGKGNASEDQRRPPANFFQTVQVLALAQLQTIIDAKEKEFNDLGVNRLEQRGQAKGIETLAAEEEY